MLKKTLLLTALLLGATSVAQPISVPNVEAASSVKVFPDIQGHWAQSDIEVLVNSGAINGFEDGTYRPQGTITRAQFSKILAVLMGSESTNLAFSNMKNHWAGKYVNGLEDDGIIIASEYPNGYNPEQKISRLEMSKMIARGLSSGNSSWKATFNGFEKLKYIKVPFKDKSKISISDMPYVALANGSGIVRGRTDGSYDPQGLATRGEAATMLNRYLNAKGMTPAIDELVNQYKGEKSIHDYSKSEFEGWIDKDSDLKRLNNHPIVNDFHSTLELSNKSFLSSRFSSLVPDV